MITFYEKAIKAKVCCKSFLKQKQNAAAYFVCVLLANFSARVLFTHCIQLLNTLVPPLANVIRDTHCIQVFINSLSINDNELDLLENNFLLRFVD